MRNIRDIHSEKRGGKRPVISFEFYPPKTEVGIENLFNKTAPALSELRPDFISVTYGAGGSTRGKTLDIAQRVQNELDLPALLHLTCVNATAAEIGQVVEEAKALGISNILALRGDPPSGSEFEKTEGGFEFSYQLIEFLKEQGDFSIGTAGFPEGHVACADGKRVDWDHLCHKIDCGADFVVTQLFFDNRDFYEFRDYIFRKLGREVPIAVGILPILSGQQIRRFTQLCGAKLTTEIEDALQRLGDDDQGVSDFGIEYASRQCRDLQQNGVEAFHFYCLNKAQACTSVLKDLDWVT